MSSTHRATVLLAAASLVLVAGTGCDARTDAGTAADLFGELARREAALDAHAPPAPSPTPADPARGRYVGPDGDVVEFFDSPDGMFLRMPGAAAAPVRGSGDDLEVWLPGAPTAPVPLQVVESEIRFLGATWRFDPGPEPPAAEARWSDLLGVYARGLRPGEEAATAVARQLYIVQWEGEIWLQVGRALFVSVRPGPGGLAPMSDSVGLGTVPWAPPSANTPSTLRLGGADYTRELGVAAGPTFRIEPVAPVETIRRRALEAEPPAQPAGLRPPELVDLTSVVPDLSLDIRYASTNNFMGAVFYDEPRAFMQRPAAEALARVQRSLRARGYGLLVHDAYRPWFATRMFWDATPVSQRQFVADPAQGSRHNRGCAVDLTLVDLSTGTAVEMTGGYDEFTERSYPFYPGGTDRQRWHRELLRRAMEAERFAVYEYEWWHFDYHSWADYPILNVTFDSLDGSP